MELLSSPKHFLEYLLKYFENNKEISFNELSTKISPELRDSALLKFTLSHLIEREGALIEKRVKGDIIYELGNFENLKNYINSLEEDRKEEEDIIKKLEENIKQESIGKKSPESQTVQETLSFKKKADVLSSAFVYSVPDSKRKEMKEIIKYYPQYNFIEFSGLIKSLLSKAKIEVLISSPFMDYDGINFIIEELKLLAENNVKLKILTRNITSKNYITSDITHSRKLMGFRNIFHIFNAEDKGDLFLLKELDISVSVANQNISLHSEGIHQKMIIVDNNLCYIGSGELTLASLRMNGECGILISGNIANFWKEFFNVFWNFEEAKIITQEQIDFHLESH